MATDLERLIRRILSDPESVFTYEPAATGQLRGRMHTGWFDLTQEEASLLESLFFGPQGA